MGRKEGPLGGPTGNRRSAGERESSREGRQNMERGRAVE